MHFIDLQAQYHAYQDAIDRAVAGVLQSAQFIQGPDVAALETALARYVGVPYAIGVASGTDALLVALMARDIAPGDEVITTPFTFIATAEVIALLGAKSVFVDVEPDTLNLDPARIEAAITPRTRAIVPVSLYGQCADFAAIHAIAEKHGLFCLEDACQSMGATYHGKRSCALTHAAATSFFPSKPLGCYGDGGMLFTDDQELAERVRAIRVHGQKERYRHDLLGVNARLDTLQAAILLAKLPHLDDEIAKRHAIARDYADLLTGHVQLPAIRPGLTSVFAQYTIRHPRRDHIAQILKTEGIPTAVHYPIPLHLQPVFAPLGHHPGDFPVAEQAAQEVLSLPMHPFLTRQQVEQIAQAVIRAIG